MIILKIMQFIRRYRMYSSASYEFPAIEVLDDEIEVNRLIYIESCFSNSSIITNVTEIEIRHELSFPLYLSNTLSFSIFFPPIFTSLYEGDAYQRHSQCRILSSMLLRLLVRTRDGTCDEQHRLFPETCDRSCGAQALQRQHHRHGQRVSSCSLQVSSPLIRSYPIPAVQSCCVICYVMFIYLCCRCLIALFFMTMTKYTR